jgi:hypothetical protein
MAAKIFEPKNCWHLQRTPHQLSGYMTTTNLLSCAHSSPTSTTHNVRIGNCVKKAGKQNHVTDRLSPDGRKRLYVQKLLIVLWSRYCHSQHQELKIAEAVRASLKDVDCPDLLLKGT